MTVTNPNAPPTAGIAARGYRTAAFTLTSATWTKVPIDTLSFDTRPGALQTGNGRWVCPVAGNYQVNGNVAISGAVAGNVLQVALYLNGAAYTSGMMCIAQAASFLAANTADVIPCNVGDFLELWAFGSAAFGLAIGPQNYLSLRG